MLLMAIAMPFFIFLPVWQEYQLSLDASNVLQEQLGDLNIEHEKLRLQYDNLNEDYKELQAQYDNLDLECRKEAGRAEVRRLETAWGLYYSTCMLFLDEEGLCLQSARNGYVKGAQDLNPALDWDRIWHFIQFGEFLEEG
jgi:hypothetical protein